MIKNTFIEYFILGFLSASVLANQTNDQNRSVPLPVAQRLVNVYNTSLSLEFCKQCIKVRRPGDELFKSALSAAQDVNFRLWLLYQGQPQALTPQFQEFLRGQYSEIFLFWRRQTFGLGPRVSAQCSEWNKFISIHFGQSWARLLSWSYNDFLLKLVNQADHINIYENQPIEKKVQLFLEKIQTILPIFDNPLAIGLLQFFLSHLVAFFDIGGSSAHLENAILSKMIDYCQESHVGFSEVLIERNKRFQNYVKFISLLEKFSAMDFLGTDQFIEQKRYEKEAQKTLLEICQNVPGLKEDFCSLEASTNQERIVLLKERILDEYSQNLFELERLDKEKHLQTERANQSIVWMTVSARLLENIDFLNGLSAQTKNFIKTVNQFLIQSKQPSFSH